MSDQLFDIKEKVIVFTGGTGVLAGAMAKETARRGARVVLLGRSLDKAKGTIKDIEQTDGEVLAIQVDLLNRQSLEEAHTEILEKWGRIDVLVNAAGGNSPEATTSNERTFFDIPEKALQEVIQLNLTGSIVATQVFAQSMAQRGDGCIINISSMSASRPLTRIVGYGASKSGIDNFTEWLSVDMAKNYSPSIRVNAIAPGFFETTQNRALLRDPESGDLSERGQVIIDHTPMGRFGDPDELTGALIWLISPASKFVTGQIIRIDGGFSAFAGV